MDLVTTLPLAALAVAFEACLGYPQSLYRAIGHPVTWIGHILEACESRLNQAHWPFARRRLYGFIALGLVLSIVAGAAFLLVQVSAGLPSSTGLVLTALLGSSLLAQRSLHGHVRAVAVALEEKGLAAGREAVGKIVGRDVAKLDESGICRAAIESLAENFSDAVVAPAFFLALFGLPGGACYKALNTADSMIGHKSERFLAFGFAAAKLDDLANLVPARVSALLVVLASALDHVHEFGSIRSKFMNVIDFIVLERDRQISLRNLRKLDCAGKPVSTFPHTAVIPMASPRGAWQTALRDSRGHPSPNAGWPEAAFAGALGLRIGGPRSYGQTSVDDAWIGTGRDPEPHDVFRALALYRAACGIHGSVLALGALLVIAQG